MTLKWRREMGTTIGKRWVLEVLGRSDTRPIGTDQVGQATITHNSPWKITLSDGSVIELSEDFDPLGFGISLQDKPDDTTTSSSSGSASTAPSD